MPSAWRFYAAVTAAVVIIAAAAVSMWRASQRSSGPPSVAVLPFAGPGAEPYFTAGFHDTIISQLARIQGLKVISRTSVLAYRDGPRDRARIARELGVRHLVEGSVRREGERLHVDATLVVGESGEPLWSARYDRAAADIFSVQADLARQIARTIDARLTVEEEARLDQAPTSDLAANELYLRALEVEQRSPPDKAAITQALGWLDEALARDPGFALAHAQASRLHMTIYWVVGEYDKARDKYFARLPRVSDAPPPTKELVRREPRCGGPLAPRRPHRPGVLALTVAKVSLGAAALSLVVALIAYLTYRAARSATRL